MCNKDNEKKMITINSICSTIGLAGLNSLDFLNNLLISNLAEFENNTFQFTALCNSKGRIIASMWINIISPDEITLICPKNLRHNLLSFFNMRKFRQKIDIEPIENNIAIDLKEKQIHFSTINTPEIDNTQQFYAFMFAQNLPWIDANNTEKFIPQHVNLDQHKNIMSFNKGCYPGQEIIARLKYLGKIKKRMHLMENIDKQALMTEAKNHQAVSPIIHCHEDEMYQVQVIRQNN